MKYSLTKDGKTSIFEATKEDLNSFRKAMHTELKKQLLEKGLAKDTGKGLELIEDADFSKINLSYVLKREDSKPVTTTFGDFIKGK